MQNYMFLDYANQLFGEQDQSYITVICRSQVDPEEAATHTQYWSGVSVCAPGTGQALAVGWHPHWTLPQTRSPYQIFPSDRCFPLPL